MCIGCKACEVACKEWNGLAEDGFNWSGNSYDNTGSVGHSTWRHVKFVEHAPEPGIGGNNPDLASWVFSSDVCKHCENAGCLEACPTGAIVRTEFGGVFVQPDICNGCSYCVVACPFGVVQRNKQDGRAFKCTFCYDRQKVGLHPACSTACPTESIKFGPIEQMRLVAQERMEELASPRAWTMPACTILRIRAWGATRVVPGARRSTAVQPAAKSRSPDDLQQSWLDKFGGCGGTAVGRQPFRLPGERQTMSSNPQDRPTPEHSDWARENRLFEIRREAERKGHVDALRRSPVAAHRFLWPRLKPDTTAFPCSKSRSGAGKFLRTSLLEAQRDRLRLSASVAHWIGRDRETGARLPPARRGRRDCFQRSADLRSGPARQRFLAMMRVFKPQSPMSVGAWTLAVFGSFSGAAAFAQIAAERRFRSIAGSRRWGYLLEGVSAAGRACRSPTTPAC